jgi:signal transduction histidine kinase
MASVRARVTAAAALAALGVLAGTGVLLVRAQHSTLTESLDEQLDGEAGAIAQRLADESPPRVLRGFGDDDTVAQVVSRDGVVLARSDNARDLTPLAPWPASGRSGPHGIGHLPTDDAPYRLVSIVVDDVVIHVAATTDDVSESVAALRSSLLVAVPVVVLLLAALTWRLVGRTLRPVEAIRAEVEAIGGGELHRRVPVPPTDDEVGRLARTMNAMLDRVQHAAQRQERFVADASHELRSPLARMRAEVEVDLAHPATADLEATHRSVLEETAGLQALVDDLLLLARSDAGAPPVRREEVAIDEIVRRQAARHRDHTAAIDLSGVAVGRTLGDHAALDRAVGNLLDNAMRHATRQVLVDVTSDRQGVELTIADDGPGVPIADRSRVFDRFAQVDESRHHGGTGLGLAIVADIVRRHGGSVALDPDHHPGARFIVRLPPADGAAAPRA